MRMSSAMVSRAVMASSVKSGSAPMNVAGAARFWGAAGQSVYAHLIQMVAEREPMRVFALAMDDGGPHVGHPCVARIDAASGGPIGIPKMLADFGLCLIKANGAFEQRHCIRKCTALILRPTE